MIYLYFFTLDIHNVCLELSSSQFIHEILWGKKLTFIEALCRATSYPSSHLAATSFSDKHIPLLKTQKLSFSHSR